MNIREWPITNKILELTRKNNNSTIDRLETERKISVICNRVREEILQANKQHEQHVSRMVYLILKEELK